MKNMSHPCPESSSTILLIKNVIFVNCNAKNALVNKNKFQHKYKMRNSPSTQPETRYINLHKDTKNLYRLIIILMSN